MTTGNRSAPSRPFSYSGFAAAFHPHEAPGGLTVSFAAIPPAASARRRLRPPPASVLTGCSTPGGRTATAGDTTADGRRTC